MKSVPFTHLRAHSHYSLLEALPKIPELVKRAKLSGMTALALTDSGNLYGAIEFYKECVENDIKPIIGVDFYVAARARHDKEARVDDQRTRLVLLAENVTGYKNLLKLVTYSYLEGFYYKPRIDRELLDKYNGGLIAIAKEERYYKEILRDRFFLESELAIYDVYYLNPEDKPALETVLSIQEHLSRGVFDEEKDLSFRTSEQARKDFSHEQLLNSAKIAERCNLKLELGKWIFPELNTGNLSPDETFRKIVLEGIKNRNLKKTRELEDRIEYELKIIKDKGFPKYFLVVADLLGYAHKNGILTNVRGSVAGSLVTYLSGITDINPLEYQIPFERFLNPDRPSPPDIDLDIADNRRDELIDYAREKYGADRVAQIGTFGTMAARAAARDVTRALGFSYDLGDRIAKLIPLGAQGFPMTIDRALKESPELKELYDSDPDTKTILEMAKKIEGNARHVSVHAAGVVISPTALTDYTPLQYDTKGENKIITQYDMYSLDPNAGGEMTVGLLKFDLLGIRNLAIIVDTLERLKKIEGKKLTPETIPIDDTLTFQMLARGETEATFQLNGQAITKFLIDLKPTTIHDINAMVALYRPGPMQFIPLFIERKHNPKLVRYLDPALKPILEKTYGVLVYQDDLLMIAKEIAGYSWGEVDKFRKAVGKKIPEEMRAQKEKFIKGVVGHSLWPEQKAQELWSWIEPFAAYGFNKAHSVSYGWVVYITAYLKANFPEIYMSAVLTAESGDVETIGVMVNECKRMGIEVLPPSVNESFSQFSVIKTSPPAPLLEQGEGGRRPGEVYKIRFGLTTIKNFGQGISTSITQERKINGKFQSLADFLDRIRDKNLNKKSLESLIKSGALDEFGERGELLGNLEMLLSYHKERAGAAGNQDSLFATESVPSIRLEKFPEATLKDKLAWEKELLGLYVSGHPLEQYKEKFMSKEMNIKKLDSFREGTEAVIGGIVEEARDVLTKNNERMVFMKLSDFSGSIEVAVFPRVLSDFREFIQTDNCIAIKGRVSKRKGGTSFIAEKIKAL